MLLEFDTYSSTDILKNLGLELDFLNYYDTCEPIAYYSMSKENPQNILVLENKDTYYTMRKQGG